MTGKHWSQKEKEFVAMNYHFLGQKGCKKAMDSKFEVKRSLYSIQQMASKLKASNSVGENHYTIKEFCSVTDVSREAAYSMIKRGKLKTRRIGGRLAVHNDTVEAILETEKLDDKVPEGYITVKEFSDRIGYNESSILYAIKNHGLNAFKVNSSRNTGRWVINLDIVKMAEDYLSETGFLRVNWKLFSRKELSNGRSQMVRNRR